MLNYIRRLMLSFLFPPPKSKFFKTGKVEDLGIKEVTFFDPNSKEELFKNSRDITEFLNKIGQKDNGEELDEARNNQFK